MASYLRFKVLLRLLSCFLSLALQETAPIEMLITILGVVAFFGTPARLGLCCGRAWHGGLVNSKQPSRGGHIDRGGQPASAGAERPARSQRPPRTAPGQRRPRSSSPRASRNSGVSKVRRGVGLSVVSAQKAALIDRSTWKGKFKAFLPTLVLPHVTIIAVAIIGAISVLLATGSSFVALPATIAQLWLLAHAAPVASPSTVLSVVPVVPAFLVARAMARWIRVPIKDRVSISDLVLLQALTVVFPLALTGVACGMLYDAASVLPVAVPPVGTAMLRAVVVHEFGLIAAMGVRLWRLLVVRWKMSPVVVDAALYARDFLLRLGAVGVLAVLVSLIVHGSTTVSMAGMFGDEVHGGGPVAIVAMIALSLLYLLNAAVWSAAVLSGSEMHVGDGVVSVFGVAPSPLPPLPLFAAMPVQAWVVAPVLLLAPVAVSSAMAYRRVAHSERALSEFAFAGLFAALGCAVAVFMSSGDAGAFGFVGSTFWLTVALVALWCSVPGILIALIHGFMAVKAPLSKRDIEPADDEVAETDVEDTDAAELEEIDVEESETEEEAESEAPEGAEPADPESAENLEAAETTEEEAEAEDPEDAEAVEEAEAEDIEAEELDPEKPDAEAVEDAEAEDIEAEELDAKEIDAEELDVEDGESEQPGRG